MKCRPSSARPETPVLRKLKWKVKVVHEKVVAIERNTVKRGKIVLSPNKCRNKEIYENIKAKMDKISNYAVKDAKKVDTNSSKDKADKNSKIKLELIKGAIEENVKIGRIKVDTNTNDDMKKF